MFHKWLLLYAHKIREKRFSSTYYQLRRNQWRPLSELENEQEKNLQNMVNFVYHNVPYYHKLFNKIRITPHEIKKIEDLEKLPILTKDIVKQNIEDFKPTNFEKIKYSEKSTGGSTGVPFRYRVSNYDRFFGWAILYRGWEYGGYNLGDKMVFLAGSSLNVGVEPKLVKLMHEIVRNVKKLSSFDMGDSELTGYVDVINSFKPKFLRGYASSIYFFSNWIEKNHVKIKHSPLAVFTTSDRLYPQMRERIESVFNCDVFDAYSLNDGGVSAFECPEKKGFHIDTERSILEVVNENCEQLDNGEGRILATSLHNYSMPFIRYETGDVGTASEDVCDCGRGYKLLKEVLGRSVDVFITPEGKNVHGWFFLYIFWKYCTGIKEYQVVQKTLNKIVIKIVPEDGFDEEQLKKIRETIRSKSENWDVDINFVDKIERTDSGKFKFIIREYEG